MIGQGRDDVISVVSENTYQGVYKTLQIKSKDGCSRRRLRGKFLDICESPECYFTQASPFLLSKDS